MQSICKERKLKRCLRLNSLSEPVPICASDSQLFGVAFLLTMFAKSSDQHKHPVSKNQSGYSLLTSHQQCLSTHRMFLIFMLLSTLELVEIENSRRSAVSCLKRICTTKQVKIPFSLKSYFPPNSADFGIMVLIISVEIHRLCTKAVCWGLVYS